MIVFVHGVPETAEMWDKVRAEIGRESVALALPGFGNPRPEGFGATKDDYVDWVRKELEQFDDPVDLVGHDWGAGITHRIATRYGDGLRSWAHDVANVFHPDYDWHDFAKLWQTPGDGEAFFESQNAAAPADRAAIFESFGVSHDDALALASKSDDAMASCILDLYRSAVPNPYADWSDSWRAAPAPGLVMHFTDDPFDNRELAEGTARASGARFEVFEGLGHWWALQGPEVVAPALVRFWDGL